MKPKNKTIILIPGFRNEFIRMDEPPGFKILKLTNSLDYAPGQVITKAQAEKLCDAPDWHVTIMDRQ